MIVVTGGAGFIGQTLIERLKKRTGEEILSVDFKTNQSVKNMHPQAFIHKMADKRFASTVSVVFHNGACSDTTNSDVHYMMSNNFDYSSVLLRRCMDQGTRIIYASSASVYGMSRESWFNEEDNMMPANTYAKTKALFDDYASMFFDYPSQIVGLRYFNVYGRNESHKGKMASVIYKFFKQKESGEIVLFEKSHLYRRDFVHVDDIVDINFFFWENPQISGIFNAGTGEDRSFQEIGDIVSKRYNLDIKYVPMPAKLQRQYQEYTCADVTKLQHVFDYVPTSLEQGIDTYLNHLENK